MSEANSGAARDPQLCASLLAKPPHAPLTDMCFGAVRRDWK